MPPFSSFLAQTSSTSQSSMPSPTSSSSQESPQQLSNESFSFGWLAGVDEPSFEAGPDAPSRHRSSTSDALYEFDFGLSRPLSPVDLAHADQIFSNGFLLPLHAVVGRSSKSDTTSGSSSGSSTTLSRSLSLDSSDSYLSFSNRYQSQRFTCTAAAGRLASLEDSPLFPTSSSSSGGAAAARHKLPFLCARKYLCFLLPWNKKARRGWRLPRSKKTTTAGRTSPLTAGDEFSSVHSCRGNRMISDSSYESTAIDDAILHCKKSVLSK
ncbi:uncharacterized protein M6B38_287580 [Iris pallida]|uniref:Membrane-associated kinase regulator 6 n=1 Tax=Iris pallida TaxID=29817 RepID=A0AAX6HZC5_IRIPA|nr:uncharacterized protein M6B38_287580 [Iris pallida]